MSGFHIYVSMTLCTLPRRIMTRIFILEVNLRDLDPHNWLAFLKTLYDCSPPKASEHASLQDTARHSGQDSFARRTLFPPLFLDTVASFLYLFSTCITMFPSQSKNHSRILNKFHGLCPPVPSLLRFRLWTSRRKQWLHAKVMNRRVTVVAVHGSPSYWQLLSWSVRITVLLPKRGEFPHIIWVYVSDP